MLKRQNASKKSNNVTMYMTEGYWAEVGKNIHGMGQYIGGGSGLTVGNGCPPAAAPIVTILAAPVLLFSDLLNKDKKN